jgi:CRISPR-associated protein Cas5d
MKLPAVDVKADFACFTRPEMKVERTSYEIPTPSALRNILQCILWKPAIDYQIDKIEVLLPIKFINLRRNEIGNKIAKPSTKIMQQNTGNLGLYIEDNRQLRAGLFLRDVAYRIHASFVMTNKAGANDNLAKFFEMFQRRLQKGQCFTQPYMGTREFSCSFQPADDNKHPITESKDFGWMLYDIDFSDAKQPMPLFYQAKMEHGVINIPTRSSTEVRG